MKGFLVFAMAVILLLSLASVASAASSSRKLVLDRIVIIPDGQLIVRVSIDNNLGRDFENGKVTVVIPELGVRAARNVDEIGNRDTKTVLLDLPEGAHGDYYVRIVVNDDGVRRVKHRLVTI